MPVPTQLHSLRITPLVHDPKETKVDFGATVEGVDLNDVDPETFAALRDAVLKYRLLVFKGQSKLHPKNQLAFVQRFSPGSTNFSHALDPSYLKRRGNGGATIPGVPQCQILGFGKVPPGHYGLSDDVFIARQDHRKTHKTPLSDAELEQGYTRMMQLHFDGALYGVPPPFVGSLLAVHTPKGDDLTLTFDNANGRGEKRIAPGSTAYFNAAQAWRLLTAEQRETARHSTVTYAPHAFSWIASTKFTSDGSSIVTEGKEVPLEHLPPWEPSKLKTMPMVWYSPLDGTPSLMIHGQCALRVNVKRSADDEVEVLDDLGEVRAFLQRYQLPVLRPEYVYAHNHQEGDLAVWYNQGMWHSITEFPERCGRRIMHQVNLGHNVDPDLVPLDEGVVQILLVPVHPIKRSKFDRHVELLRQFASVPLADVPPDRRGERAVFSSSPTTPGNLLFSYLTPTTWAPQHPLSFLSELQVHRRIQGIIGILDATEYRGKSLGTALASFQASLKSLPKTFATKVYGFDPAEDQLDEARKLKENEGLILVPHLGDVSFFLKTVLADFAGDVLFDFSNMAAQLESRTSIPTPQETPGAAAPFSFAPTKRTAQSTISTYSAPARRPEAPAPAKPPPPVDLASLGLAAPPQSRTATGPLGSSTSGNRDGFLYGQSIQTNMATQAGAASSPPPGAQLVDARARKRVAGREKKLMGDMWLLSGRLNEAINSYNDAVALTKAWPDQVWQASALEGLVVALVIQATRPKGSQGSLPPSLVPPRSDSPVNNSHHPDISTFLSAIPDRLSQAISLYEKMLLPLDRPADAPPPDPDRAHPLVYVEACLRCAHFYLAVSEAHGNIPRALDRLAAPTSSSSPSTTTPPLTGAAQARTARLTSLSPSNTVPRSTIAQWLSAAYSPHLALLALPVRLRLTAEIASLFGRIGYRRKEAFVLRELAALCAEGVAGRSIEVFAASGAAGAGGPSPIPEEPSDSPRSRGASDGAGAASASASAAGGGARARAFDRGGSIVRTTSDPAGNDSIVRIVEKVCEAFGIEVAPRLSREDVQAERKKSIVQGRTLEILESEVGAFGWPGLQLGVLKDAISISEALPEYQAAIRFTVTGLRSLSDTMPPHEQYELAQNIPRVFAAATRRGASFELEYWGPSQLVMSLEVVKLSSNRVPHEHALMDAELDSTAAAGPRNPFLYDPRRKVQAAKTKPSVVQNETTEVYVTLQNPFLFELEIQSIELSTSGVPFACDPLSTVIPPGSFHTVRLTGTPREPGTLVIRGCNIRLAGCVSREFVLPVWDAEEEEKQRKTALLDTSRERIKVSGLDAVPDSTPSATAVPSDELVDGDLKFLECAVVPEMPLLWMRSTSLTHGALMLYDGEISTIRIGVENTSSSPIDFVKITFADSLSAAAQTYLAENELAPTEAFELEGESVHRPVFRWNGSPQTAIAPGASHIFEIQCRGKIGCGFGSIQLDYGFLDRDVVQASKTFFTRQLFCDVFMTVHRAVVANSLELSRLKALPEGSATHGRSASVVSLGQRGAALDKRLEDSLREIDDGEHCLVAVDVMNVYGKPFEVKLERHEEQSEFYQVRQRIEPGATLRMLVRLDRIALTSEQLEQPIPALSERQFVVAKVKRSPEEARLERELFWYREELLRRVKLSWNEVGSLRSGEVSLRQLYLDKPMLDVLRGDAVEVELFLEENPSAEPGAFELRGRGSRLAYSAVADDFIDVCARMTNHSPSPLELTLRLDLRPPESSRATSAALVHLARYVVVEGVSPISLARLEPGATCDARIPICLLAQGQYELGCVVEEVRKKGGRRRAWGAREPLVVDVER